jgi:hypothetical protein
LRDIRHSLLPARRFTTSAEDAMADKDAGIVCWDCGTVVPIRRVTSIGGERVVICPECGRLNSLDKAGH